MFCNKSVSEEDLEDLHGKVVLVTGGNSGIGFSTAQFLVRKGAKVYIAARDETRALAAVEKLKEEGINDGSLHFLKLDLSEIQSAKKSAEQFLLLENRLDILVNNAGRMTGPLQKDANGLLDMMVVNYISPFVFTETLLPLLKSSAAEPNSDVRVVNVSSTMHSSVSPTTFKGREALNKEFGNSFNGVLNTYGYSKLANILHCKQLQRRLDQDGIPITCLSLHPGVVQTPGLTNGFVKPLPSIVQPISNVFASTFFKSTRDGAMTSAFAAASKEVRQNIQKYKGSYLVPCAKLSSPSKYADDERLAQELYDSTVDVLNELKL